MNHKKSAFFSIPESWSRFEYLFAPILIVLATVITYGVLIPQLGYYRDDWYTIWAAQSQGAAGILSLFKGDRPFNGWLYIFDYWLVGNAPLGWHVYTLMIKILSGLSFLWLMRELWPQKKMETTFITLLFVVYPGFYQQPNALTYKQMILAYGCALLSFALTIAALKTKKTLSKITYAALALLLAAVYLLIFEVLIGLEAARLLLIWYFFQREMGGWKIAFRKTITQSFPYLFLASAFVFWRIFLFQSTRHATRVDLLVGEYASTPLHTLARFFLETFKDIFETTVFAWSVPYYQFTRSAEYRDMFFALGLGLLVIFLGIIYWRISHKADADATPKDGLDWLLLGAAIVVITTIPVIAAGRNAIFAMQWDRYTYQSSLGVALFFGGVIFYIVQNKTFRWAFLASLLIAGVVTQYFSAAYNRDFWKVEREAWWQLSWRAPQIKDGTTIIGAFVPGYRLAEDYEVWAPANLVYHPGEPLKLQGQIMYDQLWLELESGAAQKRMVRSTVAVNRDYGNVIIISQPTQGACLHLLDGNRADQTVTEPVDVRMIAKYSDVSLVDATARQTIPPAEFFGAEPTHTWCYFYQKMDLARQMQDWKAVANLANEAISKKLNPSDLSEWMPALEAYIHLKDSSRVKEAVRWMRADKYVRAGICANLEALKDQPSSAGYDRAPIYEILCTGK